MEQITRTKAEKLMLKYKVVKTDVKQIKHKLCVFFTLSNNKSFLVKYDVRKRNKSYYLKS